MFCCLRSQRPATGQRRTPHCISRPKATAGQVAHWPTVRDLARFGYLFLRQGRWQDQQIVSADWVKRATTPGPVGPDYGYLWWLNAGRGSTGKRAWPDAPTTSFAAIGAGSNTVWVDPEHDLVIVWRWHDGNPNELIKRVLAALN